MTPLGVRALSRPGGDRGAARAGCPSRPRFSIRWGRSSFWTRRGDQAIHSANFDHLRVSIFPLAAIPIACFCPTNTTSFLPRVMPV